jgi:hypothetical protein
MLLATCPSAENRNGSHAVTLAKQACEVSAGKDAACLDSLAAAYAESDDFEEAKRQEEEAVRLAPALGDFEARSRAVAEALRALADDGTITGWRDEDYPVAESFHAAPLLRMERAAVPAFGVRAYGVHLNGHVGRGDNMRLWVARRSRSRPAPRSTTSSPAAAGRHRPRREPDQECAEAALPAEQLTRAAGRLRLLSDGGAGGPARRHPVRL